MKGKWHLLQQIFYAIIIAAIIYADERSVATSAPIISVAGNPKNNFIPVRKNYKNLLTSLSFHGITSCVAVRSSFPFHGSNSIS